MKKIKLATFLLALLLSLQCLCVPVSATEATETQPTETIPSAPLSAVPDVAYGGASINYGCRTINGKTPLAGSDRILQTAQAAFVYDANTQTVIYSYNPDTPLMPGSLAKIMTAMVALEHMSPDTPITCSTRWNEQLPYRAQVSDLMEGEELTMDDLLYCLIVESANDAALIIANNIAPNEAAFVEMMNQKARSIGCTNTSFANCTGLDNDQSYTTARDMAKIVLEATKNEHFREIFACTDYTLQPNNRREKEYKLEPGNHLMYEKILPQFYNKRVKGGMPSYASGSGASLACIAEDAGMSLVIITMGGSRTFNERGLADYYGNFEEVLELLQMSFNNYRVCRLLYPGQVLEQFPVNGGNNKVTGSVDVAIDTVLPSKVQTRHLIFRYQVANEGLSAPIAKDAVIGTVQVWYGTSCVTEAEMYAANPVKLSSDSGLEIQGATRDDSNITGFLIFVGVVALIILIPFTLYVIVNRIRRAIHMAKRRRRRKSRRRSR